MKSFSLVLLVFLTFAAFSAKAEEPVYSIENVTGDLYRFQSNNHYGVFLVTEEGIILADPINNATATWLKGELDARFGVPVKYVIYTTEAPARVGGGTVFEETAKFVSHTNAYYGIAGNWINQRPDKVFSRSYTISLGGKDVVLKQFSETAKFTSIGVFFKDEEVLFLGNFTSVDAAPNRLVAKFRLMDNLKSHGHFLLNQFSFLVSGNGDIGTKSDLRKQWRFLLEVLRSSLWAQDNGLGEAEAIKTMSLGKYKDWENFSDAGDKYVEWMFWLIKQEKILDLYQTPELVFALKKPNPNFSWRARAKRICGSILVEYDVDKNGKTRNVKVIEVDPTEIFSGDAINAAKKYTYAKGFPAQGVRTRIFFRIQGGCSNE